jgi:heme/copper-type cytochrome/quinol oxidase subunit 3
MLFRCAQEQFLYEIALLASGVSRVGSAIFAILHIREWAGLIHEGVRLFENPWGSSLFGVSFFSITGLHPAACY